MDLENPSAPKERISVKRFQQYEVGSTVIAALLVIWLKYQDLVDYGGTLASACALVALLMPMEKGRADFHRAINPTSLVARCNTW